MTSSVEDWRGPAYDRFEAALHVPLLVLSVAFIPVLVVPEIDRHLGTGARALLDGADYAIWAVFLVEYVVRFTLSRRRLAFVRHNLPDLALVALPMLRPLRVLRSARALRLSRFGRLGAVSLTGTRRSERSLHSRVTGYVAVVAGALMLVSAVVVMDLERGARGANIRGFGDALWWAFSTVTTVGYGDRFPVTAGGRAVAGVLMLAGVSLFGVITAAVAAWFVRHVRSEAEELTVADLAVRLDRLEGLLTTLARSQGALDGPPATEAEA